MLFVPFVTVISPVTKLVAWFCWFTVIVAVVGVGVVSAELSNENVCIFELTDKLTASLPGLPVVPSFNLKIVIVSSSITLLV